MYRMLPCLLMIVLLSSACSNNNVTEDNGPKKFLDSAGLTGCFGLFDNGKGNFTIYNLPRFRDSAYPPAATFNIINSLIGLETGKISNEKMLLKWDGISRLNPNGDTATDWNKDLTMQEAFKVSATPYFQEIARKIGKDSMQKWIDTLGYGQRYGKFTLKNNLDTFWLDNTLKITADEELGVVKKLYFDQLPFFKGTHKTVRSLMLEEDNSNYKLSYKTGLGKLENGNILGWVAGWIEENNHPYFFVLQLESPNKGIDMPAIRIQMLKRILKEQGFFDGKK